MKRWKDEIKKEMPGEVIRFGPVSWQNTEEEEEEEVYSTLYANVNMSTLQSSSATRRRTKIGKGRNPAKANDTKIATEKYLCLFFCWVLKLAPKKWTFAPIKMNLPRAIVQVFQTEAQTVEGYFRL